MLIQKILGGFHPHKKDEELTDNMYLAVQDKYNH